jgi:hypothetical protein
LHRIGQFGVLDLLIALEKHIVDDLQFRHLNHKRRTLRLMRTSENNPVPKRRFTASSISSLEKLRPGEIAIVLQIVSSSTRWLPRTSIRLTVAA